MIVRKIRPEELKRTRELFSVAFDYPYDCKDSKEEVYKKVTENPETREDAYPLDKYAAFEDDDETMFSCLSAIRYPMTFDGHRVPMAGIGGVSSLPTHRNRGGIRGCFTTMLPDLYEQGVVFSCLYPFSTAYYRKFGYELHTPADHCEIRLSYLPKCKVGGHSVLVDEQNREKVLPDVKAVYEKWQDHYNGMIVNEGWEYRFITQADPYKTLDFTYVYYKEDGTPAAFLTFRNNKTAEGQKLNCKRFVFADREGLKGLFALIKTFEADYLSIELDLPDLSLIEPMIPEWSFGAAKINRLHMGMVRVINVQKALEMARYQGNGKITIQVEDGQIEENRGFYTVTFTDGRAVNVAHTETAESCDIHMPINQFSRFLFGTLETEALVWCEDVEFEDTPQKWELFRKVFYRKSCFLMEYF